MDAVVPPLLPHKKRITIGFAYRKAFKTSCLRFKKEYCFLKISEML